MYFYKRRVPNHSINQMPENQDNETPRLAQFPLHRIPKVWIERVSRGKCSLTRWTEQWKRKTRARATVKRDTLSIAGQISISYIVRRKNDPTIEAWNASGPRAAWVFTSSVARRREPMKRSNGYSLQWTWKNANSVTSHSIIYLSTFVSRLVPVRNWFHRIHANDRAPPLVLFTCFFSFNLPRSICNNNLYRCIDAFRKFTDLLIYWILIDRLLSINCKYLYACGKYKSVKNWQNARKQFLVISILTS